MSVKLVIGANGFLGSHVTRQLVATGADHAVIAARLPMIHRDPFDRMLIAQAMQETLALVSNEHIFDRFGVARLW